MAAKLRAVVAGDPEGEFIDAVAAMPSEFLECRGSQHLMVTTEPFRVVDSAREDGYRSHGGFVTYAKRTMTCSRCGMIRHDYYSMTSRRGHTMLEKINATYEPPPGYATKGLGRIQGNRGLVLGMALEREINGTPVRGRGRPRRGQA